MVGVTIRSAGWELPLEESNIQLLYRPASEMRDFLEPAQYALKWGLERQNQRTEVLTCISEWNTVLESAEKSADHCPSLQSTLRQHTLCHPTYIKMRPWGINAPSSVKLKSSGEMASARIEIKRMSS